MAIISKLEFATVNAAHMLLSDIFLASFVFELASLCTT